MDNKLRTLFDFQQFEKDEKLEMLIREAENRYAAGLSDDDLSFVHAAGEPAGMNSREEYGFHTTKNKKENIL